MRKLVLYSEQILPETAAIDQRLLALMGKERPRIGYIPSAADPERKYYREQQTYYAQYGITMPVYLELDRDYDPSQVAPLFACDAIHLSGGNTFYFLYWLRQHNLLAPLRRYVARGGVLIGVSAGAILMTPDISTSLFCGDTPVEQLKDYAGLALVDFAFVPHFGELAADQSDLETYSQQHHVTVYGCPDGAGIVVNGDQIECIGEVVIVVDSLP